MLKLLGARWLRSKALAIGWFILMCALFILPGSAIPKQNFLDAIQFDKWVHIGLFGVLCFLVSNAWQITRKQALILLWLMAFVYGTTVEFVQENFVSNRSFDLYDIAADITGAVLGIFIFLQVYKKNKPL